MESRYVPGASGGSVARISFGLTDTTVNSCPSIPRYRPFLKPKPLMINIPSLVSGWALTTASQSAAAGRAWNSIAVSVRLIITTRANPFVRGIASSFTFTFTYRA
jgi:hypothetical protein